MGKREDRVVTLDATCNLGEHSEEFGCLRREYEDLTDKQLETVYDQFHGYAIPIKVFVSADGKTVRIARDDE